MNINDFVWVRPLIKLLNDNFPKEVVIENVVEQDVIIGINQFDDVVTTLEQRLFEVTRIKVEPEVLLTQNDYSIRLTEMAIIKGKKYGAELSKALIPLVAYRTEVKVNGVDGPIIRSEDINVFKDSFGVYDGVPCKTVRISGDFDGSTCIGLWLKTTGVPPKVTAQ